jgi:septum formation protein
MSTHPRRVVLASASPRRKALLEAACLEVVVRPSGVEEVWPGGGPAAGARALARRKADAVPVKDDDIVVAADTCVVLDGVLLEKPADRADARRMLAALAGRTHEVVTGYCVRKDGRHREGAVHTKVSFRALSQGEIERYVDSGEPFDKAGGYGIQGAGGALVDHVDGSYTNVVGLPLAEVLAAIEAVA